MASLIAWSPEGIRTSTSTTPEEERPGIRWAHGPLSPPSPLYEVTLSWVELTGFEPVAPSLRKMRTNSLTRGNGPEERSCGAAVERAT